MKLNEIIVFLSLNILALVTGRNEEYIGYRVYNVKLETVEQEEKCTILKSDSIDYWRKPSLKYNVVGQAMVPPSHFTWFEDRLAELGVAKDVLIEDVYEYLSEKEESSVVKNDSNEKFSFNNYYRYNQILDYIKSLESSYENSEDIDFNVIEAGTTAEGRPLVYIKLARQNSTRDKPVVVVEAGINPRQWITIPSSLNIVNKLTEANQSRFLDNFEWIVIPVLNPDGYEYTHTNLRLWSKSRSTQSNFGAICPGVNINRNFDIDWLSSDSSSSPCSHLYGGTTAFSEVESRLIQSLLEQYWSRIRLYVSLQNNGGFISYPWQYERAASGLFIQHHILGVDMINAMQDNYDLGVASLVYGDRASGTSTDYMRNNGVLFTYNIDAAPRGEAGVMVPAEEIPTIAEDVWRAVSVAVASFI